MQRLDTLLKSTPRGPNESRCPTGGGVLVIGGLVSDVVGKSDMLEAAAQHTSTPGAVWEKDGGVGRNISEGIARLGATPCTMVGAVGSDTRGRGLKARLADCGVDTRWVAEVEGQSTAVYQAIMDREGTLLSAVADMRVLEHTVLPAQLQALCDAALCDTSPPPYAAACLDGNVSAGLLDEALALLSRSSCLVVFEPTSVPKSAKVAPSAYRHVAVATPNDLELHAMAAHAAAHSPPARTAAFLPKPGARPRLEKEKEKEEEAALDLSAAVLLSLGMLSVVATLGPRGVRVYLSPSPDPAGDPVRFKKWCSLAGTDQPRADVRVHSHAALPVAAVVDTTGAGDSLTAGTVAGLCLGKSLAQAVDIGLHAARCTLSSPLSVSDKLREAYIGPRGVRVYLSRVYLSPSPDPAGDPVRFKKWCSLAGTDQPRADVRVHSHAALPVAAVVDTTGAGDSLTAGTVAGLCLGKSLAQAVDIGLHAARCTLSSPLSVSDKLREAYIGPRGVRVYLSRVYLSRVYLSPSPDPAGDPVRFKKWCSLAGTDQPRADVRVHSHAALPVAAVVDTTGAGDSLTAGTVAGLCLGKSLARHRGCMLRGARYHHL
ncbi:Pseudouridine kinase [Diplonema papillatum]|nr:Pseudouridine kinase [Diplonema papillatum]